MSRHLTEHVVQGDPAPQLTITVLDEPGAGGANHHYSIDIPNDALGATLGKQPGLEIHFQKGPIKEHGVNGVTQEALLAVVIDRLRSFQAGPYPCRENEEALAMCGTALLLLQKRTRDRITRGVEGKTAI